MQIPQSRKLQFSWQACETFPVSSFWPTGQPQTSGLAPVQPRHTVDLHSLTSKSDLSSVIVLKGGTQFPTGYQDKQVIKKSAAAHCVLLSSILRTEQFKDIHSATSYPINCHPKAM